MHGIMLVERDGINSEKRYYVCANPECKRAEAEGTLPDDKNKIPRGWVVVISAQSPQQPGGPPPACCSLDCALAVAGRPEAEISQSRPHVEVAHLLPVGSRP